MIFNTKEAERRVINLQIGQLLLCLDLASFLCCSGEKKLSVSLELGDISILDDNSEMIMTV